MRLTSKVHLCVIINGVSLEMRTVHPLLQQFGMSQRELALPSLHILVLANVVQRVLNTGLKKCYLVDI